MISEFKFESYKIDSLNLETQRTLGALGFIGNIPTNSWKINIALRTPSFFKNESAYVCGMDINWTGMGNDKSGQPTIELVLLKAGISGLFKIEGNRPLEENEKNMVLIHFPALLFPYLRSALTGLIANSGLGTFIFPLINVHELIKDAAGSIEIEVVENDNEQE